MCSLGCPASSSKDAFATQDVYHIVDHYGHLVYYPLSLEDHLGFRTSSCQALPGGI